MQTKPDRKIGIIQLTAGAVMISFSAVFVKIAQVGPTVTGFYRMLFGGLILLAITRGKGHRIWFGGRHFTAALLCGVFFALDLTFWHRSILYIGPGLATLLSNFQVFFLAGFGILVMREKTTLRLAASVPLAMAGLYLITGINWDRLEPNYRTGVILGLVTALCYSAYILTLRKSQSGADPPSNLANITLISLIAAPILGFEAWVMKEAFHIPNLQTWGALLGYGAVSQVLGWVLISKGLLKIETSRVGLILLLQPIMAFVWDILFFARPTTSVEALGAVLALFAIYLGTVGRK